MVNDIIYGENLFSFGLNGEVFQDFNKVYGDGVIKVVFFFNVQ